MIHFTEEGNRLFLEYIHSVRLSSDATNEHRTAYRLNSTDNKLSPLKQQGCTTLAYDRHRSTAFLFNTHTNLTTIYFFNVFQKKKCSPLPFPMLYRTGVAFFILLYLTPFCVSCVLHLFLLDPLSPHHSISISVSLVSFCLLLSFLCNINLLIQRDHTTVICIPVFLCLTDSL